MASNSSNVGSAGQLIIVANETVVDAPNNRSFVVWNAYFNERVSNGVIWEAARAASANTIYGALWSGTFAFDWRPAGLQSVTIVGGGNWFPHAADGTGSIAIGITIGDIGTVGAGGSGYVGVTVPFTTIRVLPGTPTSLVASRVSDTQVSLNWAQSSASNGQPTQNTIQKRVNDGSWEALVTIGAATSATVLAAANQKIEYRVSASNSAGTTPWSNISAPVYTTPGTPSGVVAAKNAGLDVIITFSENVNYSEYTHELGHGVVAGGVTTWDGASLTTVGSGVLSYTHIAPNSAQVHIYRVRSKSGALSSDWVVSNSVQLLTAPNKPTVPAMTAFTNKAAVLPFNWVHNPIDTTPQKSYEFSYSTDGGATWTSTGKVTSTDSQRLIAASTYAAGVALTMRVRTWGSATSGGSEGTGASPWSDLKTVTFKTVPVATITSPPNGSTLNDSTLRVTLGFTQAEAATFVKAQVELWQGVVLLETLDSTLLVGITMATPVQNGISYVVKARVQDSNGLWSGWVSSPFDVVYLAPVPAGVTVSFLPDTGYGQIDLIIPASGAGEAEAATVSITRTIEGVDELIVDDYPSEPELTFLDTTPVVNGTNTYTVTTKSLLGAQTVVVVILVTTECRRAYLSKGSGFDTVAVFGANLEVSESLSVASETIEAAGRTKPVGLYGVETSVELKVSSFVFTPFGSTVDQLRSILLMPGKACYRDASGRRVFGSVKGAVRYNRVDRGDLSFTITETS